MALSVKQVSIGFAGVVALILVAAGTHYAYFESRKSDIAAAVDRMNYEINNPEVEVSVIGDTIFLRGWVVDDEDIHFAEILARAVLSERGKWDLLGPPAIINRLAVYKPRKTAKN